ncbi:hypothetical protein CBL_11754 [Carabus blaptoides fortunei]
MLNEREQVVQDDDVPQVTMQQMMSHLTTMLGMNQIRDNELGINIQSQPNVSVPYSEIFLQIPIYGGKKDTVDIETRLKRVDDVQRIENFTLRTQMVCAQHKTIKSLFQNMKMVAAELNMDKFWNDSQKEEPENSSRKQEPGERTSGENAERKPCSDSKLVSTNANIQKINFVSTASKFIKKVLVRNITLAALVDTGSKMNLIKDSFVTDLPMEQSNTVLAGLNNSRLQCDKITNLTVTIDNCIYDMSAVIVPADAIGNDVILGQEFLDSVEWHVRKDSITFSKS